MHFFSRKKPPVSYRYIYIGAFVLYIIIVIQFISVNAEGQVLIRYRYLVLFALTYLIWAWMIDWIWGLEKWVKNLIPLNLQTILAILFQAASLACLHFIITNFFYYGFIYLTDQFQTNEVWPSVSAIFVGATLSRMLNLGIIYGILKAINTYKVSKERAMKISELENQLHLAQLEALRTQLNPHFLFNALHALHTLIGYNDEKAKSMTIKISNLLRKMLERKDQQLLSLAEELEYLKEYLGIEAERFHDRLSIQLNIAEDTKSLRVPPLLLQPLIENAIKHGISQLEEGGFIRLNTSIKEKALWIEITNSIPKMPLKALPNSTKLGIDNCRRRLKKTYGADYALFIDKTDTLFKVTIQIKKLESI